MARRILNRKDLRAANDAAERRLGDDEEVLDEEAGDEEEDEEEKDEADADIDAEVEDDEEDEEAPVVAKKKKAAPKVKAKPKPRSRTAKVTRLKVVWGVFNNSNQCVASFPYPQKAEAEAQAAKLTADKRNTHFVQPVKEPMEEKKE